MKTMLQTNPVKFRVAIFLLISIVGLTSVTQLNFSGPVPKSTFVNFESPHVSPLALTPDGHKLLAVNTADNRLEVFQVEQANLQWLGSIPVGLDPVSVRVLNNTQVWVVNHVSDNVSIVDINSGIVLKTLETENEPCDVVFAGSPQKAFVTCSEPNTLLVFDLSDLNKAPERIPLLGEDPRMLAVSPDQTKVFGAFFESGNGSTLVAGDGQPWSNDGVTSVFSPYGLVEVPPNDGDQFNPPLNPNNPPPISTPMIVKKDDQGRWMDDNDGDWSAVISGEYAEVSRRVPGWDLPDRDVFTIDANDLEVRYQKRLMNLVMALAIHPKTNKVTAVGTEAHNEIRFEPNLNGTFIQVMLAQFNTGQSVQQHDLNPHLNYSQPATNRRERERSIGDPRGIAWRPDGTMGYVTGMGSNNVIAVDQSGHRLTNFPTIEVGEGPTGIVVDDGSNQAFVLNKFDGSISILDLEAHQEVAQIAFYDPTPQEIKKGRPLLYDTHEFSGLGHISCASCHVDARTDQLAWDLGNPAAPMNDIWHPMKGPLRTQTLQDIIQYPSMHHRGDKKDLFEFAQAYVNLQGVEMEPTVEEMQDFEDFLSTIYYPPNPYRNLDNSVSNQVRVPVPNGKVVIANAGLALDKLSRDCNKCHQGNLSRSVELFNHNLQVACNLRGLYDRTGMYYESKDGSTQGFGLRPEGSASSSLYLHHSPEMLAVLLQFDGSFSFLDDGSAVPLDAHAAVGKQVTLHCDFSNADLQLLTQLIRLAEEESIGLIAKGIYQGTHRGFYFLQKDQFQSDKAEEIIEMNALLSSAKMGNPVSFTAVPYPTRIRMGVDRDADGIFDLDEDNTSEPGFEWTQQDTNTETCTYPNLLDNKPPIAVIDYAFEGGVFQFSAARSEDSDGAVQSVQWLFENGDQWNQTDFEYQFPASGIYEVTLMVIDDTGLIGMCTETLHVGCPGEIKSFVPMADAYISRYEPEQNFGKSELRVFMETNRERMEQFVSEITYLRFRTESNDFSNLRSAKLLIHKAPGIGSKTSFKVYQVESSWNENRVNWNNQPQLGDVDYGIWNGAFRENREIHEIELDLALFERGWKTYSLALVPYARSFDPSLSLMSRETTYPPRLVLEFEDCQQNHIPCSDIFKDVEGKGALQGVVASSNKVYLDRSYEILSYPAFLDHAPIIATYNNDKFLSQSDLFRFELTQDATLYVAYDSRAIELPNWLRAWKKTDLVISTTDHSFLVYEKPFLAGSILMPGNFGPGASGVQTAYFLTGVCSPPTSNQYEPFSFTNEPESVDMFGQDIRIVEAKRTDKAPFEVSFDVSHLKSRNVLTNQTVMAYPNPFDEQVNLAFPGPINNYRSLTIMNAHNQLVYQKEELATQNLIINTRHWIPGLYVVYLELEGGGTETYKLVKAQD